MPFAPLGLDAYVALASVEARLADMRRIVAGLALAPPVVGRDIAPAWLASARLSGSGMGSVLLFVARSWCAIRWWWGVLLY